MTIITKEHIQKLSQGDEAVFKSIFDDFYPRLVGLAMKYVHDLMVSEDLASEVFKKVWEKREFISEIGSFESFLYTSVRNASFNHLRNQSRKQDQHKQIANESEEYFFEEIVFEEEVHHQLHRAISALPEKGRKVFELSTIYGWKDKEIAEEMDITLNTVKTHKKRALKALRERLGKQYIYLFFYL